MLQVKDSVEITTELGQALRQADTLVFHYRDGQSFIRAIKKDVGVWKEEKEIRIDCETSLSNCSVRQGLGKIRSASHVETSVQYANHIQTALSKVRKGDHLGLMWVANNNNNNNLTNAELYRDELHLIIYRGNKREEYLIAVSTTPNNTAKMVKNETTPYSVAGE